MVLGKLLVFGAGIYGGIYLDQNYKVPRVDDPKELWEKLQEWMSQYKKDK